MTAAPIPTQNDRSPNFFRPEEVDRDAWGTMTTDRPKGSPTWPHCDHVGDPDGTNIECRGARLPGHDRCLFHATRIEQEEYLSLLRPGDSVDHRGTHFDDRLLDRLLYVMTDAEINGPRFGSASFDEANFSGPAAFRNAVFNLRASFNSATFGGTAWFVDANFGSNASFNGATFAQNSWFTGVTFSLSASFIDAKFIDKAWFLDGTFARGASFNGAHFVEDAGFLNTKFAENTWFAGARFERNAVFFRAQFDANLLIGPIACKGDLNLSSAVFGAPVTLEVAAATVTCERTQWLSTATLRCRYATINLADAVLAAPVAVLTHSNPFTLAAGEDRRVLDESGLTASSPDPRAHVLSIRGVDATHLVLTDIDLANCIFSGAFHLDQLRLEGDTLFAGAPASRGRVSLYSRRSTLAEEHRWRARRTSEPQREQSSSLGPAVAGPGQVAALYRALRLALESRGDAPGAADFYYGEMEMRRHDLTKPRAERVLVSAYWLLSGYGLRATRAVTWLFLAMIATVAALVLWGQPSQTPTPTTAGTIGEHTLTLHTLPAHPVLTIPLSQRFTRGRIGQAVPVVLDAALFRNTDQNLTPVGTYIDMAARLLEPTLLALAILAVRGRVKR